MNIWKITRKGPTGWDEYFGFVVAARTLDDARKLCADEADRFDGISWTDEAATVAELVGRTFKDGQAEIILDSFNAG